MRHISQRIYVTSASKRRDKYQPFTRNFGALPSLTFIGSTCRPDHHINLTRF